MRISGIESLSVILCEQSIVTKRLKRNAKIMPKQFLAKWDVITQCDVKSTS